ncbi:hypothetical protein C8Q75DRAFT_80410 [Abortiporus biennis]|nr:hypothetical protein C8Q75DRAFT_80410 [Abortiporus biennis]
MTFGIDRANLASIFLESILYGVSLTLYAAAITILVNGKTTSGVNKALLATTVIMFILGTIHVGSDLQRILVAFLESDSPKAYLIQTYPVVHMVKSTSYAMQTLVGDGFLLYRVYLVWKGNLMVCTPVFLSFLTSWALGILVLRGFALASPGDPVFAETLTKVVAPWFSVTLFTNFLGSTLLAARIYYIHRKVAHMSVAIGGRDISTAAAVIVESGSIYSICLAILLVLYLSKNFAQYILLDAVTQIIGIVFSLIIVRVGLGLAAESSGRRRSGMSASAFSLHPFAARRRTSVDIETFHIEALTIPSNEESNRSDDDPKRYPSEVSGFTVTTGSHNLLDSMTIDRYVVA